MVHISSEQQTKAFGAQIGALLKGGELIELIGDVGAGKTTFVKGLARGLDIDEAIQSPSFTISRVYDARDTLRLVHYDFYRLDNAGIMKPELYESIHDTRTVTVVEWADVASDVLPENRLVLQFIPTSENGREVTISPKGEWAEVVAGKVV